MGSENLCLLFLGAINLTDPGRSTCPLTLLMSILGFFSAGLSLAGGGDERFNAGVDVIEGVVEIVEVGFLRPFRDGGGGASSVSPWERNLD